MDKAAHSSTNRETEKLQPREGRDADCGIVDVYDPLISVLWPWNVYCFFSFLSTLIVQVTRVVNRV